jgi:YfiH family protein
VGQDPPCLVHPVWRERWAWLVQGTTTRGEVEEPFDFGLFGDGDDPAVIARRWEGLVATLGMEGAVHARQVHGAEVGVVVARPTGLEIVPDRDGHATRRPGALLGVTVADCVPVFIVAPERRAVAVVHAGWRGTAAGVLERALERMISAFCGDPGDSFVHLGPAICGLCYEVGPEVFEAMGETAPPRPSPIDLRRLLAERAVGSGVPASHVSRSSHCTRCTGSALFSHRGGDPGRQVGFIGVRPS